MLAFVRCSVKLIIIFSGYDEDGWPHFEYNRDLPKLNNEQQEKLLKKTIIEYFKEL
jgi:hypothetical protein